MTDAGCKLRESINIELDSKVIEGQEAKKFLQWSEGAQLITLTRFPSRYESYQRSDTLLS